MSRPDHAHDHHHDPVPPLRTVDRRSFLKAAGFTVAGTVLAGCEPRAVEKAIPYLVKPEEVTPGVPTWYASTCGGCPAACGVLVKNLDGRPVKIEGNPAHPLSRGGLCATGQAMVLPLYDSRRLREPRISGAGAPWREVDAAVAAGLSAAASAGKGIRVVTGGGFGAAVRTAVSALASAWPGVRHLVHEPLSTPALADVYDRCAGLRRAPRHRFDRASVIVSFDADFLGTWLSPVESTALYRAGRSPDSPSGSMSHHLHFEPGMSLTGANADRRVALAPEAMPRALARLAFLAAAAAGRSGASLPAVAGSPLPEPGVEAALREAAARLAGAGRSGLVVCGTNDPACQALAAWINDLLGNAGTTVDLEDAGSAGAGDDRAIARLVEEMEEGGVGALLLHGVNPVYDHPLGARFAAAMGKVPLTVAASMHDDETSARAGVVLPLAHPLEEWGDAEPSAVVASVRQPVIAPFGRARSLPASLRAWAGRPLDDADAVREAWRSEVFPRRASGGDFDAFWNSAVHDGYATLAPRGGREVRFDAAAALAIAAGIGGGADSAGAATDGAGGGRFTLHLHHTVGLLDGRHAHNPWLQELPDPVTKVVWDNCAALSPATARELGVGEGDLVRIAAEGVSLELPALLQPGQRDGVVSVALGYGRAGTDRFSDTGPDWIEAKPTVEPGTTVGVNASPLLAVREGYRAFHRTGVAVSPAGGRRPIAATQIHHSLHVPEHLAPADGARRPLIQETTLAAFAASPEAGRFRRQEPASLWPDEHGFARHRWFMAIDLTACTGCSACVVGCQAENNIPVVGRDEVERNREMTWLRIDRYYTEEEGGVSVAHQPMLCQHCEHAPCETVCPVLATVHSEEGLNQQVYNRCVGTRYCSNNCPYKVRRFNWFDYPRGDDMARLVLNPDVVVRERGVMEKCSMCVQRIQEGKVRARREGRPLADGDIRPACEQSCPAQAIVFGDLNDSSSRVAAARNNPRFYRVLEETGVEPAVGYLTLVRNRPEEGAGNG